jgi:hypothetical protein
LGGFDDLLEGDSIAATFDAPGVYPFACYLHPGMVGAVVVGDDFDAGEVSGVLAAANDREPPAGPRSQPSRDASGGSNADGLQSLGLLVVGALVVAAVVTFLERRRARTPASPA